MALDHSGAKMGAVDLLPSTLHKRLRSPPHGPAPSAASAQSITTSLCRLSRPVPASTSAASRDVVHCRSRSGPGIAGRGSAAEAGTQFPGPCCPPEGAGDGTRPPEERKTEAGSVFGRGHAGPVRCSGCFWAMFPRVSAVLPLRPRLCLPLCSGGPEASAAAIALFGAPHGPVRYRLPPLLAPPGFGPPPSSLPLLHLSLGSFLRPVFQPAGC